MTFKAEVECDGLDCIRSKVLKSEEPSAAEIEFYELEESGWLIGAEGYDYCPNCAALVKEEMESEK